MQSPGAQPDPSHSSFRAAISRARVEAFEAGGAEGPAAAGAREPAALSGSEAAEPTRRFEARIERRRGKRAAQEAAWNRLGLDGWELVAATEEHAFFRREST